MAHPQYRPAEVTPIEGTGVLNPVTGEEVRTDFQGTAERFPPVQVNNEDQEAYHASLGYQPAGKSDPSAYARAIADTPVSYVPQEYPKWVDGVLCQGPEDEAEMTHATAHRPIDILDKGVIETAETMAHAVEMTAADLGLPAKNKGGRPRKIAA